MKNRKSIFAVLALCAIAPSHGESLLQATAFPKTFDDLDFADKYAVLAEGYGTFDKLYDENGNCISGCPYAGMTIEHDKENTDAANDYFASLISQTNAEIPTETPGLQQPETPTIPTQPGVPAVPSQPIQPTQPPAAPTTPTVPPQRPSIAQNTLPLRSPVTSSIILTGDFGWRDTVINGKKCQYLHNGIDIGINTGTPIYATADGTVQTITTGCTAGNTKCGGGNGNYILLRHANGLYTEYKHLSKLNVSKGDRVTAGQLIASSGNTGFSGGPHLHYDIYWMRNGEPAYIDVLCPCASSKKVRVYNQSLNTIDTGYSCASSALNKPYKFQGNEKKIKWRIASGHCMTNANDKLPDEI